MYYIDIFRSYGLKFGAFGEIGAQEPYIYFEIENDSIDKIKEKMSGLNYIPGAEELGVQEIPNPLVLWYRNFRDDVYICGGDNCITPLLAYDLLEREDYRNDREKMSGKTEKDKACEIFDAIRAFPGKVMVQVIPHDDGRIEYKAIQDYTFKTIYF